MSDGGSHGSSARDEVLPRIERVETFEALAAEWRRLCREVGGGIFSTWEWADAWWRAFGDDQELALHAVHGAEGAVVAVLPLYVQRRAGLRIVRFVGHGPGDELGPVHHAEERATAATALRLALEALRFDVAALEQLPGSVGWPTLLDERVWRREADPVLRVPEAGWDGFLAARSANFRQQLRSRERRLREAGARFRMADARTLDEDLDDLFRLHRARWDGSGSDFTDHPFHREVARCAAEAGWLRLWILELEGRAVAAWHGFRVGPVATYYQAGRDPAFEREGVGTALLAHTIREAIAEGATEYRFGRGAEPFKYRFTEADPGLETIVIARGLPGRLALASARGARALRNAWRARARRG